LKPVPIEAVAAAMFLSLGNVRVTTRYLANNNVMLVNEL